MCAVDQADGATQHRHKVPAYRKAQAGPRDLVIPFIHPVKHVEDPLLLRSRDA